MTLFFAFTVQLNNYFNNVKENIFIVKFFYNKFELE